MKMTIKEIKTKLDKSNLDSDALIELTKYLEKYQKILEIFDRYDKGELTHDMFGLFVGKVIEDGSGSNY